MNKLFALTIVTAALSAPAASYVDATSTFASTSATGTSTGMRGYRINRPSSGTQSTGASELTPLGISMELDNSPEWELSLRSNNTDFGLYSYSLGNTPLRLRNDTGQMWIGRVAGTPGGSAHLILDGGSSSAPLDGLKIENWGDY